MLPKAILISTVLAMSMWAPMGAAEDGPSGCTQAIPYAMTATGQGWLALKVETAGDLILEVASIDPRDEFAVAMSLYDSAGRELRYSIDASLSGRGGVSFATTLGETSAAAKIIERGEPYGPGNFSVTSYYRNLDGIYFIVAYVAGEQRGWHVKLEGATGCIHGTNAGTNARLLTSDDFDSTEFGLAVRPLGYSVGSAFRGAEESVTIENILLGVFDLDRDQEGSVSVEGTETACTCRFFELTPKPGSYVFKVTGYDVNAVLTGTFPPWLAYADAVLPGGP